MKKVIRRRKDVYELIYSRLEKLGIIQDGAAKDYGRSKSGSFMDLVAEKIFAELPYKTNGFVISLAQYFKQNGDLCADPDMTIAIYPEMKRAEALSFQQAIPPVYQEVYPEPGKYAPRIKKDLNDFLRRWLLTLIEQGHGQEWTE